MLPSTEWKRKAYRKKEAQKWYAGETISLGIGQGYNAFTMLQLAQADGDGRGERAALSRRTWCKRGRELRHACAAPLGSATLAPLEWKPEHVAFIHKALYGVTQEGTSARSFVNAPYKSGGKTGTAQVIDDQGRTRSTTRRSSTSATATTRSTPRSRRSTSREIAVALVVENAGFGAGAAAPIARRVFDYLLAGKYPSEADIAATQLGQTTAPVGAQRDVDAVALPGATVDGAATARANEPPPALRRLRRRRRRPGTAGRARPGRACRKAPMSAVFDRPSLWQRARPIFTGFDARAAASGSCCSRSPGW